MRRLSALAVAALLAAVLVPTAGVSPATASTSTYYIGPTVGAGHTLPSGTWGFTDGCDVGVANGSEYRCAFEIDLSGIPSSASIQSASLSITRTGGCSTNDCQISLAYYDGNGNDDVGDVLAGDGIATPTWTGNNTRSFNILGYVKTLVSNGSTDWAGFRMSSVATSNQAVQSFDISSGDRMHITVEYVAQPVTVTVQLGGTGVGTVTSSPAGIDCPDTCEVDFEYAEPVTLTAEPQNGGSFDHWEGEVCAGQDETCEFIVPSVPDPIVAVFKAITPPVSAPPSVTPSSSAPRTPAPTRTASPSAKASTAPGASAAPSGAGASGQPSAGTSEGPVASGSAAPLFSATSGSAAPVASPGGSAGPGTPAAETDGSSILPILALLALVVLAVVGGVAWRRRSAGGDGGGATPV